MKGRNQRERHNDSGAALILAIGFVVMVGAISGGLAALVTSSMNNRGTLELVRNRQYAADGAIEEAVSRVRFENGPALAACTSTGGSVVDTLNNVAIRIDWRNACGVVRSTDGTVVAQRNVTFTACQDTKTPCSDIDVIIRAQVNFEQASSGAVTKTYVQTWSVNR